MVDDISIVNGIIHQQTSLGGTSFHRISHEKSGISKDNFLHLDGALSRHTGVWIPPGLNAMAMSPKKCGGRALGDGLGKPGDGDTEILW